MAGSWLWAGALALTVCSTAGATTVLYRDVPALTKDSDAIVRGKVTSVQSRWSGDHRRIVTDVQVAVEETLKGAPGRSVTIHQPGGVVGDIGQRVDGLASFGVGEEVLVFLQQRGPSGYLVSGMAQGKYRVERSADGRGVFAVPDPHTHQARVVDPLTHEEVNVSPKTWRLDDLRAEVRRAQSENDSSSVAPPTQKRPPSSEPGTQRLPPPGTSVTPTPGTSRP